MGLIDKLFRRAQTEKSSGQITTARDLLAYREGRYVDEDIAPYNAHVNAIEVYTRNPIAYQCINLIATNISTIDLIVTDAGVEIEDIAHPLKKLLQRPSPTMGGARFISELTAHLLLDGNAYITRTSQRRSETSTDYSLLQRGKGELHLLPPQEVSIVEVGGPFPQRYIHASAGGSTVYEVDQMTGRCELLHIKMPNPLDRYRGLSPAAAAWLSVVTHNSSQVWNKNLLTNGGYNLILTAKDANLPVEQVRDLANEWKRQMAGAGNAGKTGVLGGDFHVTHVGIDAQKLQMIEGMSQAARNIASAFGVPSMLLNIVGDTTFANMEQAVLGLYQQRIFPLLDHILGEMSVWMQPVFGANIEIEYDKDSVPALEAHRREKWESVKDVTFLTPNEKRALLGYKPLDGGDVLDFATASNSSELNKDQNS